MLLYEKFFFTDFPNISFFLLKLISGFMYAYANFFKRQHILKKKEVLKGLYITIEPELWFTIVVKHRGLVVPVLLHTACDINMYQMA